MKDFLKDKINLFLFISIVAMILLFIIKFNNLPPQLPIYYSVGEGEEQIADYYLILIIPILSFLIVMVNNYLKIKKFYDNVLIQKIFYYLNLIIIIFFTLIFFRIIFLVS